MPPILSAGLLIGTLCAIWMFVMGASGWYKDPTLAPLFFVVVLLEIGGLIWGLRRTASLGRPYGGQIVAGTMMAIIAGVIIIGSSLLFTTVAYPDYFREIEAGYREELVRQGKSEAEIAAAIDGHRSGATPMNQALQGFLGTLVTGILASAVIAIRVRASADAAERR